ncbi:lipase family protein [Pelagicoccus sp. NFK12]|uniref:Lipase family protein n=1 Tax=Pelagicoccus enzymogenes TaxID=2773457 RepID=A0A927F889_9BACT|nr:lipase family protein [Pelagicoccus enzymogenes]MBD5780278.1 lipase family protein [Pelagicoccus enzymogenes]
MRHAAALFRKTAQNPPRRSARKAFAGLACCIALFLFTPQPRASDQALSHAALFAPNKTFLYFAQGSQLTSDDPSSFSLQNAAFLAQCSLLIYVKEPEFITDTLQEAGFGQTEIFDTEGTFAFLSESEAHIVITFRGTESGDRADYLTDSKFNQTAFSEHGTAHSGFVEALAQVAPDLLDTLGARSEAAPQKTVWLTGHSLGGALATLFALQNPDQVDAVYTVGAPRTMGRKLAAHWEDKLPLFRVVNNNDIVPRLPTPPFYEHLGPTYFLTADRSLIVDPTGSKAFKERFRGHKKFMKRLVTEHWLQKDFSAIPSDYFVDHSPRLYAEILIELADEK